MPNKLSWPQISDLPIILDFNTSLLFISSKHPSNRKTMYPPSLTSAALLPILTLLPLSHALGPYKHCCSIRQCESYHQSCLSSALRINNRNCTEACLSAGGSSLSAFCSPLSSLSTKDYTCLTPFMLNTSLPLFPGSNIESPQPRSMICDQDYNPRIAPAPDLPVTYAWCRASCSGWKLSEAKAADEWAAPLVSYILPAIAFSMTIPRRRKLHVGDRWLRYGVRGCKRFVLSVAGALVAALVIALDHAWWVFQIFVLAGPMLVGSIHESVLDYRVMRFVAQRGNALTNRAPANGAATDGMIGGANGDVSRHGENAVQPRSGENEELGIGNERLDMAEEEDQPVEGSLELRPWDENGRPTPAAGAEQFATEPSEPEPEIRLPHADSMGPMTAPAESMVSDSLNKAYREDSAEQLITVLSGNLDLRTGDPDRVIKGNMLNMQQRRNIAVNLTRYVNMLSSQHAFSTLVGAPVLFYLGSFIYQVSSLSSNLGDNDTSHALAFGMWWMVIVHVAVVSGCLLASNNPSTVTAIVADASANDQERILGFEEEELEATFTWKNFRGLLDSRKLNRDVIRNFSLTWLKIQVMTKVFPHTQFEPVPLQYRGIF